MLKDIHIRDLLTIESLHLSLQNGTSMITGETGAGKSVFIEAIDIALGGRASPQLIRAGKDKAEVTLAFDICEFPKVIEKLHDADKEEAFDCVIRRVLLPDGRSRCYVNDRLTTLPFVRELGQMLFHLHSQHEQQILLQAETQRDMLDRFGETLELAQHVKKTAESLKEITQQIKSLENASQEADAQSRFLQFQLEEFIALNISKDEWVQLEAEHKRLSHAEELLQHANQLVHLLQEENDDSGSLTGKLKETRKIFELMLPHEQSAKEWIESLHSIDIQLTELITEINHYINREALDPEKFKRIDERVSQFFNLARKHKIKPEQLYDYQLKLSESLEALSQQDSKMVALQSEKTDLETKYMELAKSLSQRRLEASKILAKTVTQTIRSLALPHSEFHIELEPEMQTFQAIGLEKPVFLIKINPDQKPSPIQRVISGGELSRLSLSLHLALAHHTSIPTLIFDEVDTGLSGATAEKIGKLLRKLGESYQVFCITHQGQVAALGHQHILVEKKVRNSATYTKLRTLDHKERTEEIARMLGGEKITEKTLAHADELLQQA